MRWKVSSVLLFCFLLLVVTPVQADHNGEEVSGSCEASCGAASYQYMCGDPSYVITDNNCQNSHSPNLTGSCEWDAGYGGGDCVGDISCSCDPSVDLPSNRYVDSDPWNNYPYGVHNATFRVLNTGGDTGLVNPQSSMSEVNTNDDAQNPKELPLGVVLYDAQKGFPEGASLNPASYDEPDMCTSAYNGPLYEPSSFFSLPEGFQDIIPGEDDLKDCSFGDGYVTIMENLMIYGTGEATDHIDMYQNVDDGAYIFHCNTSTAPDEWAVSNDEGCYFQEASDSNQNTVKDDDGNPLQPQNYVELKDLVIDSVDGGFFDMTRPTGWTDFRIVHSEGDGGEHFYLSTTKDEKVPYYEWDWLHALNQGGKLSGIGAENTSARCSDGIDNDGNWEESQHDLNSSQSEQAIFNVSYYTGPGSPNISLTLPTGENRNAGTFREGMPDFGESHVDIGEPDCDSRTGPPIKVPDGHRWEDVLEVKGVDGVGLRGNLSIVSAPDGWYEPNQEIGTGRCFDGYDNDFDGKLDFEEGGCGASLNRVEPNQVNETVYYDLGAEHFDGYSYKDNAICADQEDYGKVTSTGEYICLGKKPNSGEAGFVPTNELSWNIVPAGDTSYQIGNGAVCNASKVGSTTGSKKYACQGLNNGSETVYRWRECCSGDSCKNSNNPFNEDSLVGNYSAELGGYFSGLTNSQVSDKLPDDPIGLQGGYQTFQLNYSVPQSGTLHFVFNISNAQIANMSNSTVNFTGVHSLGGMESATKSLARQPHNSAEGPFHVQLQDWSFDEVRNVTVRLDTGKPVNLERVSIGVSEPGHPVCGSGGKWKNDHDNERAMCDALLGDGNWFESVDKKQNRDTACCGDDVNTSSGYGETYSGQLNSTTKAGCWRGTVVDDDTTFDDVTGQPEDEGVLFFDDTLHVCSPGQYEQYEQNVTMNESSVSNKRFTSNGSTSRFLCVTNQPSEPGSVFYDARERPGEIVPQGDVSHLSLPNNEDDETWRECNASAPSPGPNRYACSSVRLGEQDVYRHRECCTGSLCNNSDNAFSEGSLVGNFSAGLGSYFSGFANRSFDTPVPLSDGEEHTFETEYNVSSAGTLRFIFDISRGRLDNLSASSVNFTGTNGNSNTTYLDSQPHNSTRGSYHAQIRGWPFDTLANVSVNLSVKGPVEVTTASVGLTASQPSRVCGASGDWRRGFDSSQAACNASFGPDSWISVEGGMCCGDDVNTRSGYGERFGGRSKGCYYGTVVHDNERIDNVTGQPEDDELLYFDQNVSVCRNQFTQVNESYNDSSSSTIHFNRNASWYEEQGSYYCQPDGWYDTDIAGSLITMASALHNITDDEPYSLVCGMSTSHVANTGVDIDKPSCALRRGANIRDANTVVMMRYDPSQDNIFSELESDGYLGSAVSLGADDCPDTGEELELSRCKSIPTTVVNSENKVHVYADTANGYLAITTETVNDGVFDLPQSILTAPIQTFFTAVSDISQYVVNVFTAPAELPVEGSPRLQGVYVADPPTSGTEEIIASSLYGVEDNKFARVETLYRGLYEGTTDDALSSVVDRYDHDIETTVDVETGSDGSPEGLKLYANFTPDGAGIESLQGRVQRWKDLTVTAR